ncbi:MAG: alpha/beta hydrolase [Candidatus Enteromonas sp.]|nr:alpha/beta hydrolase [Candidatus Enteromonas sp.]
MDVIDLTLEYPSLHGGTLTPFCLTNLTLEYPSNKRPAVIVVPGGTYISNAWREGQPVAVKFLSFGFQSFVLGYHTAADGVRYPEELLELASAVDYLKRHAAEYFINPDEIFVVGFSAGGHLVGNLAQEMHHLDKHGFHGDATIKAIGLSYPVINPNYGHPNSHKNLLNGYDEETKKKLMDELSLDLHVTEANPPAFLFGTSCDTVVPPHNIISYAEALGAKGITYELHLYPYGEHGWGSGDREFVGPFNGYPDKRANVEKWTEECATFFRDFCVEVF